MAGDWIPMRLDLTDEPEVMQMAEILGVREEVIVGYLHKVWSWASRKCHAGSVTNVTLVSLGRVTNLPGFPEVMRDVGWLVESEHGIEFPNWDRWLSNSAKSRQLANARKAKQRKSHDCVTQVSRTERDIGVTKTGTREEKRREENNSLSRGAAVPHDEWKAEWDAWVETWEGRTEKRFDPVQAEFQILELLKQNPSKSKADLKLSLNRYSKRILDSNNDYDRPKAAVASAREKEWKV